MPVNATFRADFTSFQKALGDASVKLKSFESDAQKVDKSISRIGNDFSGNKVIQQAHLMTAAFADLADKGIGLTDKELKKVATTVNEASEKMRRMGLEVPPGFKQISDETRHLTERQTDLVGSLKNVGAAFGVVFSAQAAIAGLRSLITNTVEYADALSNLSTTTGISIQGLQGLEAIGVTSGVTMQELAKSVGQLQKHLDDPAAISALERMGLEYENIRQLAPEQQFLEIAKSVAAIDDPVTRMNTGTALFGKTWETIAPAIVGDIDSVATAAWKLSDAQVKALDQAGDAWDQFAHNVKVAVSAFIAETARLSQKSRSPFALLSPTALAVGAFSDRNRLETPNLPSGPSRALIDARGYVPEAPSAKALSEQEAQIEASIRRGFDAMRKAAVELDAQAEDELIKFANTLVTLRSRSFGGLGTGPAALPSIRELGSTQIGTGLGFGPGALASGVAPTTGAGTKLFGNITAGAAQSVVAAIQGGGNIAQSVAGTVGSQIGQNIVKNFGTAITGSMGKVFGGAINAVLPGLGALAGPLIGFVGKLFGKSEESSKVSPLRDEFFKMQGGLETLNPKVQALTGNLTLVDNIFKAKTAEQYNAALKALNDTLASQEQALQTLTETAQRYGFTLEELGPALQRSDLDKQAQQLYKDFQVLNQGGLDHEAILGRMSSAASDYVNKALKLGVEVPIAMKPFLEELASTGKLLDENGNQITDLEKSGVSFALTMSEGFKQLIESVDKLTRAIAVGLGVAIKDIPDPDITGRVHWDVDDLPQPDGWTVDGAAMGGMVTRNGIQHFASGGKVLPFRSRGSDTVPAMLTPGEMVLTAAQQRSLLKGGAGPSTIHVHVEAEGRELAHVVVPYLPKAVGDVL